MSHPGEYEEWSDTWVYICAGCGREFQESDAISPLDGLGCCSAECDAVVEAELKRRHAADPVWRADPRRLSMISHTSHTVAYTTVYVSEIQYLEAPNMRRTAKIFMNNRNQAVRLPKEFQFNTREVFIRKEGSDVILSPRPTDWSSYLANEPVASEGFMEGVQDLPVQEREP